MLYLLGYLVLRFFHVVVRSECDIQSLTGIECTRQTNATCSPDFKVVLASGNAAPLIFSQQGHRYTDKTNHFGEDVR